METKVLKVKYLSIHPINLHAFISNQERLEMISLRNFNHPSSFGIFATRFSQISQTSAKVRLAKSNLDTNCSHSQRTIPTFTNRPLGGRFRHHMATIANILAQSRPCSEESRVGAATQDFHTRKRVSEPTSLISLLSPISLFTILFLHSTRIPIHSSFNHMMLSPSTDPIFSDYETGEETEASDSETKEIYGCHTEENPGFEEEDGLEEAFDFSERFVHEEDKEEHLFASVLTSRSQSNKTHSSETTLPSAKRHGVKGKKTFGLPLDRASFKTFIDNNTTLDDEGYPLLPNGNTVYVRKPGQAKVTNWGTFGFAYTTSGGGTSRGPADWRTV